VARTGNDLDRGFYVRPTVLSSVAPGMTVAREEIFGPVLVVIPAEDEDEAVKIANDSEYGLSGGVWGADEPSALAVARRLRTGQVAIKRAAAFNVMATISADIADQVSVGELGVHGLEEYFELNCLPASQPPAGSPP